MEFARLAHVRKLTDQHMTYEKDQVLGKKDGADEGQKKQDQFLWTYILRPVRNVKKWKGLCF